MIIERKLTLIGWQAYRGDQIHRKSCTTSSPTEIQVTKKNFKNHFETQLRANFAQFWVLES